MAKRFTDTNKWNKPFIRGLQAPYKLLWLYILDECDHAGIWQVDTEVAEVKLGFKIDLQKARESFKGKIVEVADKWVIIDFIEFQYGQLDPKNRVHNSVIKELNKYPIILNNPLIKPLISPLQGCKDKDKEKDKDKDMDLKEKQSKIFTRLLEDRQWLESSRHTLKIKHETAEQELNEVASRLKSFIYYLGSINDLDKSDDDVKAHFINRELKLFK